MGLFDALAAASGSRRRRAGARLSVTGALALATAIAFGAPSAAASHARPALSNHRHAPKHKSSAHPCLEGKWDVTSLTLSTTGLTFTGGVGTTVDIMSNGNALGDFTPGTPLTGSEGSAKFNGTITDHYGFSSKTKALSGNFPVSSVTDNATITVGGLTKAVSPSPEQGSYTCAGKDLTLVFTSGASMLTYKLSPAG